MHILLIHQAFAALYEPGWTCHHEFARYFPAQSHRMTVIVSPISDLAGSALIPGPLPFCGCRVTVNLDLEWKGNKPV